MAVNIANGLNCVTCEQAFPLNICRDKKVKEVPRGKNHGFTAHNKQTLLEHVR